MEYWAQISVLLGIIVTGFKIWFDYSLWKAKIKVEYATKIKYEQYKKYVDSFNRFHASMIDINRTSPNSDEKFINKAFSAGELSIEKFYYEILMAQKVYSKKVEEKIKSLRNKIGKVHNLIIDSLVAKKEHQDKDKIAEKEKEVSSELNKLRDQQELGHSEPKGRICPRFFV